MATSSASEDGGWGSDLLMKTSKSVMEMAHIARTNDADEETRVFYSHLIIQCIKLQDFSVRARQTSSRINGELANQALVHLGSIIFPDKVLPGFDTLHFRLGMLNLYWNEIRTKSDKTRLDFISQWLRPGEQRGEVDKALESCADELDKQHTHHVTKKPADRFASLDMDEPSHTVCKAAQSIFDALLGCKVCSCPDQHEFGAKLELGTYRKTKKTVYRRPLVRSFRRRARNPRGDEDIVGGLISISFSPWSGIGTRPIIKTKTKAWQRIVLKLTSGQLFEMGFEKSNFLIDKTTNPISLSQCFEERHDFFTEKTKRILSLMIGSTILHLNGTSWLQPGWGSASIKFFQTTSCKTPLRPFIQTQLPRGNPAGAVDFQLVVDGGEAGDEISDSLDLGHRCPVLVALAVVLIEVHFVKPFRKLAEMHNVQLIEVPSGRFTLIDVDQVFNGDEETGKEGWRSQMPEDSPLLMAIDNCLDGELWEDEEGEALGSETLRSRVYQHVVRLLELHLIHGFSQIPLDGVDEYARDLDFGNWGQAITNQEPDSQAVSLLSEMLTATRASSPAIMPLSPSQVGVHTVGPQQEHLYSQSSPLGSLSSPDLNTRSYVEDSKLYESFSREMGGQISPQPPANRTHFHIAIICALPREADAVTLLFDHFWDDERDLYGRADGDMNTYITGRIGDHNVVLAILPSMGTNDAAAATASLRSSYNNLKLAVLVGYDYGRQYPGHFAVRNRVEDSLGRASKEIRSLLAVFQTEVMRSRLRRDASKHLKLLQEKAKIERRRADYRYPGTAQDTLYPPTYAHKHRTSCDLCTTPDAFCDLASEKSCADVGCLADRLIREHFVEEDNFSPEIFIGRVGSGNTIIKSGEDRDRIANAHNIIAFETEGAGAWDEVPCIVVKGICDYADSHKNEVWVDFAAATAAAVMKAILGRYIVHDRDSGFSQN
ncbi:hypothetical protein TrVFT333_001928 [Trichoderma virens FT-333]|nr:hypothetical protein TrVFT333_001928 [Trichoderma virens FT-333]